MEYEKMNEEQLFEALKEMLEKDRKYQLETLNLIFEAFPRQLTGWFILEALMEKTERLIEENEEPDEIPGHESCFEVMNLMYAKWME
jgi:hypothetical protein